MGAIASTLCAGATAWYLIAGHPPAQVRGAVPLVVAVAAYAWVVRTAERTPVAVVAACIAVVLTVAVAMPSRSSRDHLAYAVYGRIVAVHHANPYAHDPGEFPEDRFVRRIVHRPWLNTSSVYGPLFTGISAAGMSVFRTPLSARLFFQLLACIATLLALLIVWRRTGRVTALALVGLNPVVAVSVVNGGHNDALIGLGVLAGAVLAARERHVAAGVALGVAASIKIVAMLALAGAAVWLWREAGARAAARCAGAGAAVVLVGYVIVGPFAAWDALRESARFVMPYTVAGTGVRRWAPDAQAVALSLTVVAAVALAALLLRARRTLAAAVALPLVAYLLVAGYVLPWYVAWVLPIVALTGWAALRAVVAAAGAALTLVYWPTTRYPGPLDVALVPSSRVVVPALALCALVAIVWTRERPGEAGAPSS